MDCFVAEIQVLFRSLLFSQTITTKRTLKVVICSSMRMGQCSRLTSTGSAPGPKVGNKHSTRSLSASPDSSTQQHGSSDARASAALSRSFSVTLGEPSNGSHRCTEDPEDDAALGLDHGPVAAATLSAPPQRCAVASWWLSSRLCRSLPCSGGAGRFSCVCHHPPVTLSVKLSRSRKWP